MNYNITGKNLDVTSPMKDAAIAALEQASKVYENIIDADVILAYRHNDFIAEAIMHIDGEKLFVKSSQDDMYVAIADMGDKLLHALQKIIGKRRKIDHTSLKDIPVKED